LHDDTRGSVAGRRRQFRELGVTAHQLEVMAEQSRRLVQRREVVAGRIERASRGSPTRLLELAEDLLECLANAVEPSLCLFVAERRRHVDRGLFIRLGAADVTGENVGDRRRDFLRRSSGLDAEIGREVRLDALERIGVSLRNGFERRPQLRSHDEPRELLVQVAPGRLIAPPRVKLALDFTEQVLGRVPPSPPVDKPDRCTGCASPVCDLAHGLPELVGHGTQPSQACNVWCGGDLRSRPQRGLVHTTRSKG
jgi:hypothetical protein